MSPSRDRGLELRIVQSREELSAAWDVLGAAYDPPLRERVGDYEAYVDKVSRSAVTILCIEGCSVLGGISFYANNENSGAAFVTQAMVSPEEQGRGIGTMLFAACERESLERGMVAVALEVRRDNEGARRLYERLGYRKAGRTERGFLMSKTLGSIYRGYGEGAGF
ncbi:hypothetical protein B5F44_13560 [Gordonibacter urolithinfaciens]|uniref:GNAT family N-acetyltransferase n=1 Tax=Gordonibacter urolithinfaciens TaxID=1335613 RepID=UPI000B3AC98C|nr:GNAT family N-acetyltransferase [Gordonibacter urolithinfaciens]OUO85655.1 hypothetical protein B5F44_13560 [Gordonibacter urolithinfaciens]